MAAVPVYGGECFQEVHVNKCAGKIEGVRELVSKIDKFDYLRVKKGGREGRKGGGEERGGSE